MLVAQRKQVGTLHHVRARVGGSPHDVAIHLAEGDVRRVQGAAVCEVGKRVVGRLEQAELRARLAAATAHAYVPLAAVLEGSHGVAVARVDACGHGDGGAAVDPVEHRVVRRPCGADGALSWPTHDRPEGVDTRRRRRDGAGVRAKVRARTEGARPVDQVGACPVRPRPEVLPHVPLTARVHQRPTRVVESAVVYRVVPRTEWWRRRRRCAHEARLDAGAGDIDCQRHQDLEIAVVVPERELQAAGQFIRDADGKPGQMDVHWRRVVGLIQGIGVVIVVRRSVQGLAARLLRPIRNRKREVRPESRRRGLKACDVSI